MKKVLALTLSALFLFGISCGEKQEKSAKEGYDSQAEIIMYKPDRIVAYSTEELEEYADIAVIGTFTDDAEIPYCDEKMDKIKYATNKIRVDKVIFGDVNVGDSLKISQEYSILESSKQLVTYSDLKPMEKGDQWIFFISYSDTLESYLCVGDYSSRFPVPNDTLKEYLDSQDELSQSQLKDEIELLGYDSMGILEGGSLSKDLYYDVITTYDCTLN